LDRAQWIGAALVVALAVGAGLWYSRRDPAPPPVVVERAPVGRALLTVHVSGAVGSPGLIEVPAGSRVADAVAAAGGAVPSADLRGLNLAAPVIDGQQLVVPEAGHADVGGRGRVRINVATVDQMQSLPGVGPVLAERIVAHREEHGPFTTVEDLLDVPGIGEGKLAALRESVLAP
jgi:competence protein ComEA